MTEDTKETAALVPVKMGENGLILNTIDELWRMAKFIHASGLAPRSYKTAEAIVVGIVYGRELGLATMQALNGICVVNGSPTVWGDTALGLVRRSGLLDGFKEELVGKGEQMVAHCYSYRKGDKELLHTEYSVEDAKTAKLWNNPDKPVWRLHPKRMLKYKARAFNLRDNFPDILKGLRIYEEVQEEEQVYDTPNMPEVAKRGDRIEGESPVKTLEMLMQELADKFTELINPEKFDRIYGQCGNLLLDYMAYLHGGEALDYDKLGNWSVQLTTDTLMALEDSGIPDVIKALIKENGDEPSGDTGPDQNTVRENEAETKEPGGPNNDATVAADTTGPDEVGAEGDLPFQGPGDR